MSDARDAVLGSIRAALRDVPADERPQDVAVARDYLQHSEQSREEIIELFIENTVDYKAIVQRIPEADLPRQIALACQARGMELLIVPDDLPDAWLAGIAELEEIEAMADNPTYPLSNENLEASSGVLTGCALAIAQTGTIILDSGAYQGRRAITLIPDYHLCVVFADQIVGIVPEAIRSLEPLMTSTPRPLTFISGPSATSDIELNRVEGVHGPRTLEVIVVDRAAPATTAVDPSVSAAAPAADEAERGAGLAD